MPYQGQAFDTRRIIDAEQDGNRGCTDVPGLGCFDETSDESAINARPKMVEDS